MKRVTVLLLTFLIICLSFVNTGISSAAQSENKIRQLVRSSGPNWAPRPYKNTEYVPLKTSICSMLYVEGDENGLIDLDSITVQLIPEGKEGFYILNKNQSFSPGYSGEITRYDFSGKGKGVCIYIDTTVPLEPLTKYTVKVDAKTEKGFGIYEEDSTWSFTTEAETKTYDINASIDFSKDFDVNWHGRYFNGFVRTHGPFDPDSVIRMDYIFSDEMKAKYPNAWNLFRYEITATETFSRSIIEGFLSHFVREKETRRVLSVSETENGMLIKIEDFYGHEQYGIESNRPLSLDYHVGDEILIFDADNDRRAIVLAVNDSEQSLLVSKFDQPSKGWLIDYFSTPPTTENPYAPGLFAKGGTYLAKYNPSGTPVYYWKRLDTILDMYVNKYKQRISLNILYAYGDLSIDGKNGNRPKDYIEFHKVTYDAVTHLIERYGDQTTTWVWSIFNEPDLWPVNWRTGDWVELQKFYDYAVNAVLLAFEDKGYDSDKIIIGGLELGAIFGANVRVDDFLAHCSPVAKRDNILDYNAAYADPILRQEGKISKRVEKLCSANNGKGTPLDFISIHAYNDSLIGATKMINAKTKALDIDPEYYADLWINNYETMPSWSDFEDPGASEWTWGNGYLPTWAADFYGRLLNKALEDPRFSYGDSVLTLWGWPQNMTAYMNDVVFNVTVRDGRTLENKIMPKPIFHYLNLVSTMSTDYWMIPQRQVGGHNVSGFAAPGADSDDIRMVLYSHDIYDTQSRSDAMFNFDLDLKGLKWKKVKVTEYRFDKTNNTYYSFVVKNKTKNAINMKEFETLTDLTTLKVSNEKTYEVNNDGSLKLNLPVAANGINFVILSPADDEVEPTPSPTVSPTPTVAPTESPTPSPTVAPTMTPAPSPTVNPSETPTSAPTEKPDETPTPSETDRPVETPTEKPSESPVTNDDGIMLMALLVLISGLIITVLIYRLKVKPLR